MALDCRHNSLSVVPRGGGKLLLSVARCRWRTGIGWLRGDVESSGTARKARSGRRVREPQTYATTAASDVLGQRPQGFLDFGLGLLLQPCFFLPDRSRIVQLQIVRAVTLEPRVHGVGLDYRKAGFGQVWELESSVRACRSVAHRSIRVTPDGDDLLEMAPHDLDRWSKIPSRSLRDLPSLEIAGEIAGRCNGGSAVGILEKLLHQVAEHNLVCPGEDHTRLHVDQRREGTGVRVSAVKDRANGVQSGVGKVFDRTAAVQPAALTELVVDLEAAEAVERPDPLAEVALLTRESGPEFVRIASLRKLTACVSKFL